MRLLLDTCLSGKTADILRASGHDVVWTGSWSADPGDVAILARARDEQRILVTLDKDFGELAIVRGEPHCGIVRLVDCSVTRQAATCLSPSDITVCLPSRMSLKPTFSRTRIAC